MSQGLRDNILLRTKILQAIRAFFDQRGFTEVETPILLPYIIPEAHIDAIRTDEGYLLHTSPELCMKMLLDRGYGNIFQICKCFRKGERGTLHLPEFTMLEWYHLGIDYNGLMDECELLIYTICKEVVNKEGIIYKGNSIALTLPWDRISLKDAFLRYASVSLEDAIKQDIFEEIMVKEVEPRLGINRPVFVKDYPASMAALSKISCADPGISERFELYICGLELANGYTELTDIKEIKERLDNENRKRALMGKDRYPIPKGFLKLKKIPECAGIALGIDRLVMLFCNSVGIDEVVTLTYEEI